MGKQKENYIFEAAAILIFAYLLLNKSSKAQFGKYPERKEKLLYDMINGVGISIYHSLPLNPKQNEKNYLQKQRNSNIPMSI